MHQKAGQMGSPLLSISDDVQEQSQTGFALKQLHGTNTKIGQHEQLSLPPPQHGKQAPLCDTSARRSRVSFGLA